MALKDWKRFRSPMFERHGIISWSADGGNSSIQVSKYFHSKAPKNWRVGIYSVKQALKGYPNSKVGITKKEALKIAKNYMKTHDGKDRKWYAEYKKKQRGKK